MADILSQDEIAATFAMETAVKKMPQLKKLLEAEGAEISEGVVLGILETIPPLATRVMEKCRSDEHGFQGSRAQEAVKFLGMGTFRQIVLESLKELFPPKPPPQQTPEERIVTSYDFKHPARVNKDQLRTLENLHDNFARLLSSTFSGAMRAVVDVDTAFVDQTTYKEFIMSLSNPSCSYQFTLGPTNGQAIIDIAMPVVFAFVDRIFGGKGSSHGVTARQLTPIEIGVINRIVKRVIEDLEATWEPILRVEITDIELETNPEFMQITAANEIVILLAFEVNSTNASGLVSLCYPFFTLESILPRLGQQTYVRRSLENAEQLKLDNRLRLGGMDVEMVAELGRTKVALEEAQSLSAGDVVRLPTRTADPVTVYLGGKPKFLARPFTGEGDELKLKVIDCIPRK
jgi:flagellar motor switch protein FliM